MPAFPSEQWFNAVRELYNTDATLHSGGGGACDTQAAFKIGARCFLIAFEGNECAEVREVGDNALESTDFFLDMPADTWRAMIENIRAHGRADSAFTLNSLDLDHEDGIAHSASEDQYRQDLFYRYNQNFQDFFDASSRIETSFT